MSTAKKTQEHEMFIQSCSLEFFDHCSVTVPAAFLGGGKFD